MATQAQARASLRAAIDDVPKPVWKENLRRGVLRDQVDGTNTLFKLNNRRIVSGTLLVSADGGSFAAPATEDDSLGTFTLAVAPATALLANYSFEYFLDAELDPHLELALSFVGSADVPSVVQGLYDAFIKYAAGNALQALSSRAGPLYDASAGGKSVNKSSIKTHYLALAKQKFEEAEKERTAYYEGKGGREKPAFGRATTVQTPYTPRR
jgi:hypothetical protein